MKTTLHHFSGMLLLTFVLFFNSVKAQNTVFNIISNSPDHSTLEASVLAAKLDDDLSGVLSLFLLQQTMLILHYLPEQLRLFFRILRANWHKYSFIMLQAPK